MEAARADILDRPVHLGGEIGDGVDGNIAEFEGDILGAHERHILPDETVFGLRQNALQIVPGERLKLDPDRQAAL